MSHEAFNLLVARIETLARENMCLRHKIAILETDIDLRQKPRKRAARGA